jgi:broad specificity phosphatase PhoE
MTKEVVLMRHLQDEDNLLVGGNDAGLIEAELPKARHTAVEISKKGKEREYDQIFIFSSSKKRAEITAREVGKELGKEFPVTIEVDSRIREIDQGDYILPVDYKPGDRFQILQDAWLIYFRETFGNGNLEYRFGDPLQTDDEFKYPELAGHFRSFGENQIEFSIRFYSFIADLCDRFEGKEKLLPVVVTHQAMTARFAEVIRIAEKIKSGKIPRIEPGTMPLLEWQQFEEINGNRDVFIEFGGVTTFPLSELYGFNDILKLEIEHLKTIA